MLKLLDEVKLGAITGTYVEYSLLTLVAV